MKSKKYRASYNPVFFFFIHLMDSIIDLTVILTEVE